MHKDHSLPADSSVSKSAGTRLGCFAPTHVAFHHKGSTFIWSSRYHRKGRYPKVQSTVHQRSRPPFPRLLPVWFGYPWADISYWVAFVFTLGCVAWVINGHYALYPQHGAVAASEQQAAEVAAAAALVGGTLFEIGSWLLYWEALNPEPQVDTGKQVVSSKQHSGTATSPLTAVAKHTGRLAADQDKKLSAAQEKPDTVVVRDTGSGSLLSSEAACSSDASIASSSSDSAGPMTSRGVLQHKTNERPRIAAARLKKQQQTSGASSINSHSPDQLTLKPRTQQLQLSHMHTHDIEAPPHSVSGAAGAAAAAPAGPEAAEYSPEQGSAEDTIKEHHDTPLPPQQWRWFGLRLHDMGFMASFLQLIGATIFWVPCMFGAPTAYPPEDLTNYRTWDGVYWLFQVVGASFFIASSLLFMLEVQPAWYHPKPLMIGWHVGFWNLIGAIGFWLSGFFGFWAVPSGAYQLGGTVLSTFWGSYAFLIGSYLQLLEAINKHPESLALDRMLKHA